MYFISCIIALVVWFGSKIKFYPEIMTVCGDCTVRSRPPLGILASSNTEPSISKSLLSMQLSPRKCGFFKSPSSMIRLKLQAISVGYYTFEIIYTNEKRYTS